MSYHRLTSVLSRFPGRLGRGQLKGQKLGSCERSSDLLALRSVGADLKGQGGPASWLDCEDVSEPVAILLRFYAVRTQAQSRLSRSRFLTDRDRQSGRDAWSYGNAHAVGLARAGLRAIFHPGQELEREHWQLTELDSDSKAHRAAPPSPPGAAWELPYLPATPIASGPPATGNGKGVIS